MSILLEDRILIFSVWNRIMQVFKRLFFYVLIMMMTLLPSTSSSAENRVLDERGLLNSELVGVEKVSLTRVENRVRSAAVKIMTQSGYGSGSYVTLFKQNVVLTAAHVVHNEKVVMVMGDDSDVYVGNVIYIDTERDVAILSVPKITSKKPIKFKQLKDVQDDLLGDNVSYSGFPNRHELLTIRGEIAGFEMDHIILNSYTWPGASGSGVYDENGVYVGILVGVDIGIFDGSYHLVDSIVWVVPSSEFNMSEIESAIRSLTD